MRAEVNKVDGVLLNEFGWRASDEETEEDMEEQEKSQILAGETEKPTPK